MPEHMHINFLAVAVCAVVNMIIGALWYSPMLFAKPWMAASGITVEQIEAAKKGGMGLTYGTMFVMTFILALYLAHFVHPGDELGHVLKYGIVSWVGLVLTTNAGDYLFLKRPLKLYLINMFQYLVLIVVDCVILTMWA